MSNENKHGMYIMAIVAIVAIVGLVMMFSGNSVKVVSQGSSYGQSADSDNIAGNAMVRVKPRIISPTPYVKNKYWNFKMLITGSSKCTNLGASLDSSSFTFGTSSKTIFNEMPPTPPAFGWYWLLGYDSKGHYNSMLYNPSELPKKINLDVLVGDNNCFPITITWNKKSIPSKYHFELKDAYINGGLAKVDMNTRNSLVIDKPSSSGGYVSKYYVEITNNIQY